MEIQPIQNLLTIPKEHFPLIALTDDSRGFLGWGIKAHQNGFYSHFMWAVDDYFVSQEFPVLKKSPMKDWQKKHRIKLWWNPDWTTEERECLKISILADLGQAWYNRMYDVPQIIGFLLKCKWLQIPGSTRICSDHVDHLALVDKKWEVGKHRSPPEINRLFKNDERFKVYGVYSPDA